MLTGPRRRQASGAQGRAAAPRPLSRAATAVSAALAARGVPTRLLVGPWTHQDTLFKGGTAVAESLAWLDRYAGTGTAGSGTGGHRPVRIWVGGSPRSPGRTGTSGSTKNSGAVGVPDGLRRLGSLGSRDAAAGRGHRIRLQVAGGAHPRFARNPGNGQVDAAPADFVPTRYAIGLSARAPSVLLLLAAADHATEQTAGKAAVHA
jgi:hypothetical protein